jgi:hypothetical protein
MAAKFEISKDHASKSCFHLKAPNELVLRPDSVVAVPRWGERRR